MRGQRQRASRERESARRGGVWVVVVESSAKARTVGRLLGEAAGEDPEQVLGGAAR